MKRTVPLARTGRLRRARALRSRPHVVNRRVREIVWTRAQQRCDLCGCPLAWEAWDCHHRQLRSRGGVDSPENLTALCRTHHRWVHTNPLAATQIGFMVPSWRNPADVAVLHHGTTWAVAEHTRWIPVEPEEGLTP